MPEGISQSPPREYTQDEIKKINASRYAAQMFLVHVDDWVKDLAIDNSDVKKSDEQFAKFVSRLGDRLVVHGTPVPNKETGQIELQKFSDLDGKFGLYLFSLAGVDIKKAEYVESGEFRVGKIHIDTGGKNGLMIDIDGKTVYGDHHADWSKNDTSATAIWYKALTDANLIQRTEALDKAVEFVTQVDNKTYLYPEDYFETSDITIIGLQRFIRPDVLLKFFSGENANPSALLSKGELIGLGLEFSEKRKTDELKKSEKEKTPKKSPVQKQRESIDLSLTELENIKNKGWIIDSPSFGKIVCDIGAKIKGKADAALYSKKFNGDTYLLWNPENQSYFLTSKKGSVDPSLFSHLDLTKGKCIRGAMWIKKKKVEGNPDDPIDNAFLQEIINKLTGNKYLVQGEGDETKFILK